MTVTNPNTPPETGTDAQQTPTTADLRSALTDLRSHGELATVAREVHWNRELGTVARIAMQRDAPSLLFENITDYNAPSVRCSKVSTSLLASHRRIAILLGLDPATSYQQLVQHVREYNPKRIEPVAVPTGPVKDNVVHGEAVDLNELPVPHWHYLDGGALHQHIRRRRHSRP